MQADIFVCQYKGLLLAGVDEVGRGPLMGDVVTAAVILDPAFARLQGWRIPKN
jgi:ribonuclease HII